MSIPNGVCQICGKPIYIKPSKKKKQKTFCCSRKCANVIRSEIFKGDKNPNYNKKREQNRLYKGNDHRYINTHGYVLVRAPEDHPFKYKHDGMIKEHRLVAEQFLLNNENSIEINGKKYLKPDMIVHHKDHNKTNNDPSNLIIMSSEEHAKLHGYEIELKRDENGKFIKRS